jgi:hypothetical protein
VSRILAETGGQFCAASRDVSGAAGWSDCLVRALRDVARVVASGRPLVITFSNGCFPVEAALGDAGNAQRIERYLTGAGIWRDVGAVDPNPHPGETDPLFAVVAYPQ